jgi:protease-4
MELDEILDRRRLKRRLTFWRVAAVLVTAALIAVAIGKFVPRDAPYVARLAVTGFIGEDWLREQAIRDIADDENAKALLLRINSPGGTTTGAEELFYAVRNVAEKKPVVAVIGTVGASGGYIAAIAADHIVARETSLTGSIGVLMQTAEFTGLLEKLGIEAEALKSSPLKGEPSPLEPMTDDVRVAMQGLLDDGFDWFRGLVRERRQLDGEDLRIVTDGRVFTGRQALSKKLVDELGGEQTARDWLEAQHDIAADLEAVDVTWGEEDELVTGLFDSLAGKLFTDKPLTLDGLLSVWHPR